MYKFLAFYSLDALLSSLVVLLMIFYINSVIAVYSYDSYIISYSNKMNKLFVVSEYVVKYHSKETYKYNPNWIDSIPNVKHLEYSLSLKDLYVGFEPNGKNCIVRYIVWREEKTIRKLYVCGD